MLRVSIWLTIGCIATVTTLVLAFRATGVSELANNFAIGTFLAFYIPFVAYSQLLVKKRTNSITPIRIRMFLIGSISTPYAILGYGFGKMLDFQITHILGMVFLMAMIGFWIGWDVSKRTIRLIENEAR